MKPLHSEFDVRPDILRAKHLYGVWFGAFLGLTFAMAGWGIDALLLGQFNGLLPWLKFAAAAVICLLVGGLAGWLSAKVNRPGWSLLLWLAAAAVFAWLTVSVPLQITPRLLSLVEPELEGLLHYTYYPEFSSRIVLAYAWTGIFAALTGLLQLPLSDSAVFSTSPIGRLMPMLICLVLMGISGVVVDTLNNEPLRSAAAALDKTIQFSIDNRGKEIDRAEARRMHLGALRTIEEVITPRRKLVVSGYDEVLGEVEVLVRFESAWAECEVFYNQPVRCGEVASP